MHPWPPPPGRPSTYHTALDFLPSVAPAPAPPATVAALITTRISRNASNRWPMNRAVAVLALDFFDEQWNQIMSSPATM